MHRVLPTYIGIGTTNSSKKKARRIRPTATAAQTINGWIWTAAADGQRRRDDPWRLCQRRSGQRPEAGGGADSAAARQPTASGNIFDSIRPSFPMEERAEADGGADSAAARRLTASGNTFDRRR